MNRLGFVARLLAGLGLASCQRETRGSSSTRNMMSSMGSGMMHGMDGMSSSARGKAELGQMMGSTDTADMQMYMAMFEQHREIRRSVEHLKNGVRTITESGDPRITALLQEHVAKMYQHVARGQEVRCMSDSLPTMFAHASHYRRRFTLTTHGVAVEETSEDPQVLDAIRRHAAEVTAFVREGMPAMMKGMMP